MNIDRLAMDHYSLITEYEAGGADRDRTDDLRLAKPALSQLSYSPEIEFRFFWLTANDRPAHNLSPIALSVTARK